MDQQQVFDYDWCRREMDRLLSGRPFASELYLMPTDGSKPPVNVTRYAP